MNTPQHPNPPGDLSRLSGDTSDSAPSERVGSDGLARQWWLLAVRGGCAVVFGVVALAWPEPALASLMLLFAGYVMADAAIAAACAIASRYHAQPWGALACEALINATTAIVVVTFPLLSVAAMIYTAAFWALLSGAALLVASARFAAAGGLIALAAAASILLGGLLIVAPLGGVAVIGVWLGGYAIVFGTALIAVSLQLRSFARAGRDRLSGYARAFGSLNADDIKSP